MASSPAPARRYSRWPLVFGLMGLSLLLRVIAMGQGGGVHVVLALWAVVLLMASLWQALEAFLE